MTSGSSCVELIGNSEDCWTQIRSFHFTVSICCSNENTGSYEIFQATNLKSGVGVLHFNVSSFYFWEPTNWRFFVYKEKKCKLYLSNFRLSSQKNIHVLCKPLFLFYGGVESGLSIAISLKTMNHCSYRRLCWLFSLGRIADSAKYSSSNYYFVC